jgi:bacteriorhodopsin
MLVVHGRSAAKARSNKIGGFYASIGAFTLILWTIYPM